MNATNLRFRTIGMALAGLLVVTPACSDNASSKTVGRVSDCHQGGDGGENLDSEGCEHLTEGPFVDVTAGADAASAVAVGADHKAYRVKLSSSQPGFLRFAAATMGDLFIYADTDAPLEVTDDQGKEVSLTTVKSIAACSEVKAKHSAELAAVGTYTFRLGPGATQVTLVLELEGH